MRRALALALLATLVTPACQSGSGGPGTPVASSGIPSFPQRSPVPGEPPIVWISGRLQRISGDAVSLRDPSQTAVSMQRLAGGTTRFLVVDGGRWRELTAAEVDGIEVGRTVCAETLLDGSAFVALRLFLDATCGPTGPAP